jgi:ring-1,2-phenylacetyl-CoA epoxidase subunit PaaC
VIRPAEPLAALALPRGPRPPGSAGEEHDVVTYALRLGDDALVLAQRLCEWAARSPQLEEDVALLNLALDLLGQSRSLLTLAGAREGRGRDEDDLAFLRDEPDVVNVQLVELDNGDFGRTMARQLLVSAYAVPLWQGLCASTDPDLSAIAARRSRRWPTTWTTRARGSSGWGTAPRSRTGGSRRASTRSGRTPSSCSRSTT